MAEPLPVTERIVIPGEDLEVTVARSGGPGGQAVNTTDSRVRLRFALASTSALTETVKNRLRDQRRSWLTSDGDLLITSDVHRSQHMNLAEVRERLVDAVRAALVPPKVRHKTKPTLGAKRRRREAKERRKQVKAGRGRVSE
jgi:ribosome-associated protein